MISKGVEWIIEQYMNLGVKVLRKDCAIGHHRAKYKTTTGVRQLLLY